MAGRTKPKRTRRVWDGKLNPLEVALNAATLLTQEERDRLMQPLREAMASLRQGKATEFEWLRLATCVKVAICIEDEGVVRGLREHLNEADEALCGIADRAHATGAWRSPTCYGHELVTVDTLLDLYEFQTAQLSAKEFRRAAALAKARQLTGRGKVVEAQTADVPT